ncbi:WD40 repeat-like protein [Xylona heveae TC161]|uniref:WD40 repeat-like protein n=1 Tax=Xylona heveae (strain CBS 132557 / TC161) TaxID=1328760 RepID=A0A165GL74_XYLHT|nr:WD40 repeat-like protein [Xylona heveae TC161]KZF22325.1 WD40 repeat-like protein [Xylona heveae TC161]
MAPLQYRRSVPKDRFSTLFGALRTQTYHDPATRGPGSHAVRTLAWSPTGTFIATGSVDRTLRIWNPEKANVKYSTDLRGHSGTVERVAWNPVREAELASVSADGTVRFWDVRSKTSVGEAKIGGEGFSIAWAPDGSEVIVGRKDDMLVPISLATGKPSQQQAGIQQDVQTNQTTFSHTGQELLLTTGEGKVKILDYPSLSPLHTLNAHTAACLALELCPRGKYLAVGSSDALVTLWDTQDWVCKHSLGAMVGAVRSVGFSFDGSFIVGGSDEGTGLEIAHVETGEYVHTVQTAHPAPCVAWHPSRYWLAYSGDPVGLKIVGAAGGSL